MKMQISFLIKKNSDLHLMKMQISFYFEKFRFASNEDANQFLFLKNSNLHLMKMQISFYFEKVVMISKILKLKKNHDNKDIKNMFQQKCINST